MRYGKTRVFRLGRMFVEIVLLDSREEPIPAVAYTPTVDEGGADPREWTLDASGVSRESELTTVDRRVAFRGSRAGGSSRRSRT